jgi:hypothetical protein
MTAPRVLLVLAGLALACNRPGTEEGEQRARQKAEVPGLETAVATVAPVRDQVRAFGAVAPEAEPPAMRDARTALAEAEARRTLAAQQVRRLEALADAAVAPRKELEAARAEEASAAAAAARARQVLAGFGTDREHGALGPGEVWVIAQVMQVDAVRVDAGGDATFVADAFPGSRFVARVDAGAAFVDPATSTAPVRLRVRDPGGQLRPGMTGAVTLEVGSPRDAVVVPTAAVVYDDAQPLVFVAEEKRYSRRPVTLGVARDAHVEVTAGLAAGTRVVVTGAPSLLSASRLPAGDEEE